MNTADADAFLIQSRPGRKDFVVVYVWERRDAFDLLEVPRDATAEDVRRAYRLQSKAWHPDGFRGFDPTVQQEAARRVEAIKNARDELLDPDARADLEIDLDLEAADDEWATGRDQQDPEMWKAMARWMKLEDIGTGFDRKMAFRAGDYIERRKRPSDKELPHMLRVWDEAADQGFSRAVADGLE